jgi:Recombination endonuclease VII
MTRRPSTYTSDRQRLYSYGLTVEAYRLLLREQAGTCGICGRTHKLTVDHDHQTGQVRGLLCDPCNRAVGHLQDSPGVSRRAAEYLRGSAPSQDRAEQ